MSKLTVAVTKVVNPKGATTLNESESPLTIFVESDKIMIFPRESGEKSTIFANGYELWSNASVAQLAGSLSSVDVSAYT